MGEKRGKRTGSPTRLKKTRKRLEQGAANADAALRWQANDRRLIAETEGRSEDSQLLCNLVIGQLPVAGQTGF